jgi:hypothetical protein
MLTYRLGLYRGDSYRWRLLLWADTARTVPVDLAGVVVAAEIRQNTGSTPITVIPCVVTAPNQIDLTLSAAATRSLPASAKWDLQLTYPSGEVKTVIAGAVSVTGDITDSVSVAGMGVLHV